MVESNVDGGLREASTVGTTAIVTLTELMKSDEKGKGPGKRSGPFDTATPLAFVAAQALWPMPRYFARARGVIGDGAPVGAVVIDTTAME